MTVILPEFASSRTLSPNQFTMRSLALLFKVLNQSSFRRRFKLSSKEQAYLAQKGMETILSHAQTMIAQRLAPEKIANDGKQTPMRGHPVFVAQHATATCCRGCLLQWHQIAKDKALTQVEQQHILTVIEHWLSQQSN